MPSPLAPATRLERRLRPAPLRGALVASLIAHALAFGLARPAARLVASAERERPPAVDAWAGATLGLPGGGGLHEVTLDAPGSAGSAPTERATSDEQKASPAPATAAALEAPRPPSPEPPPAPKAPAKEPAARAAPPKAKRAETPKRRTPAKAKAERRATDGDEATSVRTRPPPAGESEERAQREDRTVASAARPRGEGEPNAQSAPPKGSGGPAGEGEGHGGEGSFGAEGPPGSRDLGRAFTRAIPPANDSDPIWRTIPAGDAGTVEIAIHTDESGRIAEWKPVRPPAPPHLASLVKRTIALLGAGVFSIRGAVGPGDHVLVLSARASDVPEDGGDRGLPESASGSAGGRFGLRYAWKGNKGTASFTQTSGRRVDVTVELLR